MTTLLHLDSSGQRETSASRQLTAFYAKTWREANPNGTVIYRDLTTSGIEFLTQEHIQAFFTPQDGLNADQQKLLELPNKLMDELLAADTLVIGAPMYNFSVPAVLKAYIDMIVRAGLTFSFEGGVPKGLLKNKKVVVVTASGGDYTQEELKGLDFVEPYLRTIFGFMGLTDVTVIRENGRTPETIATSLKLAEATITSQFQPAGVSS